MAITVTHAGGAATVPPMDGSLPALAGYEILSELGHGGMGVVYKARQVSLNRPVALKMILSGAKASDRDRARFLIEAEAIAALEHPNIVRIYEIGEHDGRPFFTLEYLDGGKLASRLRDGPLPAQAAAEIIEQLAYGLTYAHDKGIIHRDINPANVLFAADGTPKITDFGLAKQIAADDHDEASGIGDTVTPVLAGGLVYVDSGRGGSGVAVDPTGMGDITKSHLKWTVKNVPEGFSSPLAVGAYLYRCQAPGVVSCRKAATGEEIYKERLEGLDHAISPIATPDGCIYCAGGGPSYVLKAGPTFEVLGRGDLGDPSRASAAVAGGRIYLKGGRHLYGVGKK